MAIADLVLSIFGGGVTGLLGAALTRYGDYKNKQLEMQFQESRQSHEIELRKEDAKMLKLEWDSREKIALVEAESREDVAKSNSFQTALTSEPRQYANVGKFTKTQNLIMVILDFIRGVIRPGLTLYLCGITTAVYLQAGDIIKAQPIPVQSSIDMYSQISGTILYLTTTCILFWFGIRNQDKNKK